MAARWENRCAILLVLLAIGALLALPFFFSALTGRALLRETIAPLARWLEIHRYREISGYVGLGLVLVALAISVPPGTLRLPFLRRKLRGAHMIVGLTLLMVVLFHTGGKWGANLNGFLLASLFLAIFTALAGKYFENRHLEKGTGRVGRVRTVWLPVHLLAVVALLVFLSFHVFSVYYF